MKKKILVTCALPYANGPIHIGHLLEHIQADIFVRYQKMKKNDVWFICADDAHGTAIMLKAQEKNISEEFLIKTVLEDHKKDFYNFDISHDIYHSTHSKENLRFVLKVFDILKTKKMISEKFVNQFFDESSKMFLPDRYINGTCPVCNSSSEFGDSCTSCGSFYSVLELINPISVVSGNVPILKRTLQVFFNISLFENKIKKMLLSNVLEKDVSKKVVEWFEIGLRDWNISRDYPYFGFKIPGYKKKYFYVWLDAPIGYISTFKKLCSERNINFNEFWDENSNTKLYHFIGKDIIYFHSIFWPAILNAISFRKPTKIYVHGYVKINDRKMSKSTKHLITAKNWYKNFDSDSLRYYYASKISNNIEDININAKDFVNSINSGLVNKIINLATRNASFINKYFHGMLYKKASNILEYRNFLNKFNKINLFFKNMKYRDVISEILKISNFANSYINDKAPWRFIQYKNMNYVQDVCSTGINFFRIIMTYMKPILPKLSNRVEYFLNSKLDFKNLAQPLFDHKINNVKFLYKRVKIKDFYKLI
ncbi:methionine--tRNA ligase [Buchnera aphidicola (Chaitoregma tattakana)]|uniref:methionine--tRNA ligase n=1 Tax=Buchnera aphidicola TaxID=9 RepID=UPI0031B80518